MKKQYLNDGIVYLRAMEPEDLELLYSIENDSSLWDKGTDTIPYSRYSLRHFIETARNDLYVDRQLRLILCLFGSDETVGLVDLFHFEPHHLRAEIGITLLTSFRGRGLAARALELLCTYASRILHIHSLSAWVAEDNLPSRNLFEADGFTNAALLKDWIVTSDGFKNIIVYQKILK